MKKTFAPTAILLTACLMTGLANAEPRHDDLSLGQQHLKQKEYSKALSAYLAAAQAGSAEAHRWLASVSDGSAKEMENLRLHLSEMDGIEAQERVRMGAMEFVESKTLHHYSHGGWDGPHLLSQPRFELAKFTHNARAGNIWAAYCLAWMYREGVFQQDDKQATQWFEKSAKGGMPWSKLYLGEAYRQGLGVAKNEQQAIAWFTQAAADGIAVAKLNLGQMAHAGQGMVRDDKQAAAWLTQAAEAGLPQAMAELGGVLRSQNPEQAIAWFTKAANQGNICAMLQLGAMEKDNQVALAWYAKAAQMEAAAEVFKQGERLFVGKEVKQDYAKALALFTQSAEAGHPVAMSYVGMMHRAGAGCQRDDRQALAWYTKAAEAGDATAMCRVGVIYSRGFGVRRDWDQAAAWIKKAAEAGNLEAMKMLGKMFLKGDGVAKDWKLAVEWMEKSAGLGYLEAMNQLALGYTYGPALFPGMKKNGKKGLEWWTRLVNMGHSESANKAVIMTEKPWAYDLSATEGRAQAMRLCEQAANMGDMDAMLYVADAYQKEGGKKIDQSIALYLKVISGECVWMGSRLPEKERAQAMFQLGEIYDKGLSGTKDIQKAVAWYTRAARNGNLFAMQKLAEKYISGEDVPVDHEKAEEMLTELLYSSFGQSYTVARSKNIFENKKAPELEFRWRMKLAKSGDLESMEWVGRMYKYGIGVPQNNKEAALWFERAASYVVNYGRGQVAGIYAILELGMMPRLDVENGGEKQSARGWIPQEDAKNFMILNRSECGQKVPIKFQDQKKVEEIILDAANKGNTSAMVYLGLVDKGVLKIHPQSIVWLQKAANMGDARAMNGLAEIYECRVGPNDKVKQEKANEWGAKAIALGSVAAMQYAAYIKGTWEQNHEAERVFLAQAGEAGDTHAMLSMGLAYKESTIEYKGKCEPDPIKVAYWYTKRANAEGHHYRGAMTYLGKAYATGLGVSQDIQQSIAWYEKAAALMDRQAMVALGDIYRKGPNETRDFAKALAWYKKAAEWGNADAMFGLGRLYRQGQGVAEDSAQAVNWYEQAAKLGQPQAMRNLGLAYRDGQGVVKNNQQAYMWLDLAAYKKVIRAEKYRDELATQMTEANIKEAQLQADLLAQTIGLDE